MKTLVRFWVMVLSVVVGLSTFGYLFFGFLFPAEEIFTTGPEIRLVVTLVGAMSAGVFIWATFVTDTTETLDQNQ